eukprot:TRINITY_DN77783_c0_g1_i1.p1 TRINITY_DN77783_c0_g1~~TRINITY_DN77783_c0_g1_i1.p1  ORF type:complete len:158 (+),score=24.65 TRINITY_DN77783_c0_g1_i1:89-562(+)
MDSAMNGIFNESIRKEEKFMKKWKEEKRQREAGTKKPLEPIKRSQSSQLNYLDQTLGLAKNPHDTALPVSMRDTSPAAMLNWGVSRDGQGRESYLKRNTREGGPHERYGMAVTSTHEVGWQSKKVTTHNTSTFARRPLVKQDFFRTMGVSLSTGQLI